MKFPCRTNFNREIRGQGEDLTIDLFTDRSHHLDAIEVAARRQSPLRSHRYPDEHGLSE